MVKNNFDQAGKRELRSNYDLINENVKDIGDAREISEPRLSKSLQTLEPEEEDDESEEDIEVSFLSIDVLNKCFI